MAPTCLQCVALRYVSHNATLLCLFHLKVYGLSRLAAIFCALSGTERECVLYGRIFRMLD